MNSHRGVLMQGLHFKREHDVSKIHTFFLLNLNSTFFFCFHHRNKKYRIPYWKIIIITTIQNY